MVLDECSIKKPMDSAGPGKWAQRFHAGLCLNCNLKRLAADGIVELCPSCRPKIQNSSNRTRPPIIKRMDDHFSDDNDLHQNPGNWKMNSWVEKNLYSQFLTLFRIWKWYRSYPDGIREYRGRTLGEVLFVLDRTSRTEDVFNDHETPSEGFVSRRARQPEPPV